MWDGYYPGCEQFTDPSLELNEAMIMGGGIITALAILGGAASGIVRAASAGATGANEGAAAAETAETALEAAHAGSGS